MGWLHFSEASRNVCTRERRGNQVSVDIRLIVGQVELMLLLAVREKGEKKGNNRQA